VGVSDLGAVVYVGDLARAIAFYEATTAWKVKEQESGFAMLHAPSEHAGSVLTLVQIPEEYAAESAVADPPLRREETPIKLSFWVTDLATVRAVSPTVGGLVDPVETEWTFGSVRVCDGHDPEGNVVQFRQSNER